MKKIKKVNIKLKKATGWFELNIVLMFRMMYIITEGKYLKKYVSHLC